MARRKRSLKKSGGRFMKNATSFALHPTEKHGKNVGGSIVVFSFMLIWEIILLTFRFYGWLWRKIFPPQNTL